MPASSLLALIDDIASTLDDVAVLSKVAAKKTAGVLGDDLALNAQQVAGVSADRELPVVWAVAKGSFINKVILIPLALLISFFIPQLITPLLVIGGLFLCYEGFEKVHEKFFHSKNPAAEDPIDLKTTESIHEFEKTKIKGAIRTDFILSAEIIVITLGTVANTQISNQILVLSVIGVGMTVGVYGLVAGIVKIDDLGLWLIKNSKSLQWLGNMLLNFAPKLMRFLGIAGTIAMFLVGGGILAHAIPYTHHLESQILPLLNMALQFGLGLIAGATLVFIKIRT